MITKLKYKLIYRLLGISNKWNDKEEETEWLSKLWENKGFKSYIHIRDLSILKELGNELEYKDYRFYLGRRKEILHLAVEAKKQFDLKEKDRKKNRK